MPARNFDNLLLWFSRPALFHYLLMGGSWVRSDLTLPIYYKCRKRCIL
jgi:hypothetical protein